MVTTMKKQNRLLRTVLSRLRCFVNCEQGAMQVTEYLLMGTIICLGVIVGLVSYRNSLVLEYGDIAAAFISIDQSYEYSLVDYVGGVATTTSTSTYNDGATNQSNSINVTSPSGSGEQ